MARIDAEDILNIVYSHASGDRPVNWECEGCGDDSRDGRKLALKEIQAALDAHFGAGSADGWEFERKKRTSPHFQ